MNNIEYLKRCDEYYYNTGKQLISDKDYDILKSQLREEFPDNPYFKTVGAPPVGDKIKLPYILGSLTKTKPDGSLLSWVRENGIKEVLVSDKLDGVSVYTKYIEGELVLATTRGNGYEGRVITEKIRLIKPTVDVGGVVETRSEAVMEPKHCESLGYSLPRSAVAGILNGDEQKHLDNCKYVNLLTYTVFTEDVSLSDMGIETPVFTIFDVDDNIEQTLSDYYKQRKAESLYDIDGLVVTNVDDQIVTGDEYYPTNMMAYKVNEEAVEATVSDVHWEIKRTGKLIPVVHFEPVKISGSNVTKATGFNVKFIKDNNIHMGSKIGIVRSGDVIPYITECYTRFDGGEVDVPSICPSCGEYLDITPTGVDLVCVNDTCPGQSLYHIENFLLSHEVEEITSTTIKKLGVNTIEELYGLDDFDIAGIEGMGLKRAQVILKELEKTLNTTPEKLLKSFGIPGVGKTLSEMIMNNVGSFGELFTMTVDDFVALDGIGSVLADNIVHGLRKNRSLYNFLNQRGLKFQEKMSANLQGKVFTLTGKSDINRNDLTKMINQHGGMVKGISKSVDYLVTNDVNSTSNKTKKAKQYGTQIINYDDLMELLNY